MNTNYRFPIRFLSIFYLFTLYYEVYKFDHYLDLISCLLTVFISYSIWSISNRDHTAFYESLEKNRKINDISFSLIFIFSLFFVGAFFFTTKRSEFYYIERTHTILAYLSSVIIYFYFRPKKIQIN